MENTEEGDVGLRNAAPALRDDVYLVAGPWQPGRGQERCLGDAGADALVPDAPATHVNMKQCRAGRALHPSMNWAKFSPFFQLLAADRTKPEALQALSSKKNRAGPLCEPCVWFSPTSSAGITEAQ